jgi:transposase InsO family protein
MPFKEVSIVMQREEFCRLALSRGANVRELCRRVGISPQTGYKWLDRYKAAGVEGLADRSRRPLTSPGQTRNRVETTVLAVRKAHPVWGGRKIRKVLQNQGLASVPSASTITAILRRHQLLDGPRAGEKRDWTRFEHPEPNDLWQMDFKGHVAMEQGRCHPLTVLDDHSRYALEIGACATEQSDVVKYRLERVFERYGLPRRFLADNGPPWGTSGSSEKHTVLTVWLLDLGIDVCHGRAYHPQTQGKEERFHRSLKGEVLSGRTFANLRQAQKAFDQWRQVYNTERPHEGIGMETPATRYKMSIRPMPRKIDPPSYDGDDQVRMVQTGGWFSFKGRFFNCSKAFAGHPLALRPTSKDGLFDLCYRHYVLDQIDLIRDCR